MAKQIVANNGELPPSVALSIAVKPIPNVGAKNIRSLPRGVGACASQRARGSAPAKQSTGAEYDGVSGAINAQLMNFTLFSLSTLVLAATARDGDQIISCWSASLLKFNPSPGVRLSPSCVAFQLWLFVNRFISILGAN